MPLHFRLLRISRHGIEHWTDSREHQCWTNINYTLSSSVPLFSHTLHTLTSKILWAAAAATTTRRLRGKAVTSLCYLHLHAKALSDPLWPQPCSSPNTNNNTTAHNCQDPGPAPCSHVTLSTPATCYSPAKRTRCKLVHFMGKCNCKTTVRLVRGGSSLTSPGWHFCLFNAHLSIGIPHHTCIDVSLFIWSPTSTVNDISLFYGNR